MIPILFNSDATTFNTMGLGALSDAISCKTKEGLDCQYELEMEYPVSGSRYKLLGLDKIIFAKANFADRPQPFRVYSITKPMNGKVKYYAQHISYDLSGYPVGTYRADNVVDALAGLRTNSIGNLPFTFSTTMDAAEHEGEFMITVPTTIRPTLGGYADSIQTIYGGEFHFDQFNIELLPTRGENRGVTVYYGKNLIDLNQEENCSQVYTGVLPYWTYTFADGTIQTLALSEPVIDLPGEHSYRKIYMLDLTSDFVDEENAFSEYQETRLTLSQSIVDHDDTVINSLQNQLNTKQNELTQIRQNPNHTTAQVEAKQREIEQVRTQITTAQEARNNHQTNRNDVQDEIYETPYVPNTEYVKTVKIEYPYADTTKVQNGITWTDNGDGTITANGTATADTDFNLTADFSDSSIETEGKTYIIKTGISGASAESAYIGGYVGNDATSGKNFTDICVEGTTAYNNAYKINTNGYARFGRVFIRIKSGMELDNITFSPEIAYWDVTNRGEGLLREHAEAFIEENDLVTPDVNLTLDFYQMSTLKDRVDLGDTVSVYFERLGVSATARCVKYTWNVLEDRYESIELGSTKPSFADTMSNTNQAVQQSNDMAQAIQEEVQRTLGKAEQNRLLVEQAQKAANSAIANADAAAAATDEAIVLADSASLEANDANRNAADAKTAAENAADAAEAAADAAQAVADNVEQQEARLRVAEDEIDDHARSIEGLKSIVGDTGEWESTDTIAKIFKEQETAIQQNAHEIRTGASAATVTKLDASQVASDIAVATGNVQAAREAAQQAVDAADDAAVNAAAARGYATQARTKATEARTKADAAYDDYQDAVDYLEELRQEGASAEQIAEAEAAVATAQAAYQAADASATQANTEATRAETTATQAEAISTRADAQKTAALAAVQDAQDAADAAAADRARLLERISLAETAITQNAEQIALKASRQDVTLLDQTKNRIFTGTEFEDDQGQTVTTPPNPHVGDLWFKSQNEPIFTYVDQNGSQAWVEFNKYTDDSTANGVANNLANNYYTKTQTDAALTTTADNITAEVSRTTSAIVQRVDDVEDIAETKGRTFTTTPTPPYNIGDLWVQGENGDIFKCKIARAEGETYQSTDWDRASKYTDDTAAQGVASNLAANYYQKTETDAAIQVAADSITSSVTEQIEATEISAKNYADTQDAAVKTYVENNYSTITQTASQISTAVTSAVNNIQIGGRNLLRDTKKDAGENHTTYDLAWFDFTEHLIEGEEYTISAKITTSSERKSVAFYHSGWAIFMVDWVPVTANGIYTRTFTATSEMASQTSHIGYGYCMVFASNNVGSQGSTPVTGTGHVDWIQIEKGNKATDWSPAPDDIRVGGTNLLRYTADMSISGTSHNWRASGGAVSISPETTLPVQNVNRALRVTNTGSGTARVGCAQDRMPGFVASESYTQSCWIRASVAGLNIELQPLWDAIGQTQATGYRTVATTTTSWQHVDVEGLINSTEQRDYYSAGYVYVNDVPAGGWFEICAIKVEQGNKATAWSPNPEDIKDDYNSKFNSVEQNISSLTQTSASISSEVSKKVDTTTYNANNQAISQQISSLSSRIDQTAGSIRGIVSQEISGLEDQAESISNWFDFSVSNFLTIGQSGSVYKTQITNSAFNILHGSSVIGSFSNSGLDTSAITLSSSLSLPPFTLESINNGTEWLLTE